MSRPAEEPTDDSRERLRAHCRFVRTQIREGKVIPFLGAGANLCDRERGARWNPPRDLPSGQELAAHLAHHFGFPEPDARDLVRVSQWVDLMGGEAALFGALRRLFTSEYEPNSLHRYLAASPGRQRTEGNESPCQLIITTNYDDALERAFDDEDEPYDVVYYVAEREEAGRFVHVRDGRRVPARKGYRHFDLGKRTVILKIHGAVDRRDAEGDSFVITEDHYIDYLAHSNVTGLIPVSLLAAMTQSHFVFLGYGMRDWNLRVILHQIWARQKRRFNSWAIQNEPDPIDERFWQRHDVEIVRASLADWVREMRRLDE